MTRRLGEGHELRGPVTEEVTGIDTVEHAESAYEGIGTGRLLTGSEK